MGLKMWDQHSSDVVTLLLHECAQRKKKQVEATTEKQPRVVRGNWLLFRVAKCTAITARPGLTANITVRF